MLKFVLKYIGLRKGRHCFTIVTLVLTLITTLLVFNVSRQLTSGVMDTYQYYDTIIGPSGSQTQLLMNTLFYTDYSLGTVDYSIYQDLDEDSRTSIVIPVAGGDSYNSISIVGTSKDFLSEYPGEGRLWAKPFEAVLGNGAANSTGLKVGDTFKGTHGLSHIGHVHEGQYYTVVGILDKTGTAVDNAIFCNIETVWEAHDEDNHPEVQSTSQSAAGISTGFEVDPIEGMWSQTIPENEIINENLTEDRTTAEHEEPENHEAVDGRKITAVLIKCTSVQDQWSMASEYNAITGLQAINPATIMRGILNNIGTATKIAVTLCSVVMIMGIIVIITISMLNMYDMKADLKLLRLIGIAQWRVESIVYLQTLVVTAIAIILGIIASRLAIPAANLILPAMGITLTAEFITWSDLLISGIVVILNVIPIILLTKHALAGGMLDDKK